MIKIGRVDVSLELRKLFLNGQPMRLGTRAFDILEVLIEASGQLVTKEDLFSAVWPDTIVEESNLQVHISALRKLLGPDKDLIKTIPGRGYCLIRGRQSEQATSPLWSEANPPESGLAPNPFPLCCAPLIGRQQALEDVRGAIDVSPLVTLVGTGGIGKTQLALEAARSIASRFAEVRYVDLSAIEHPDSILSTIYDGLAHPPEGGASLRARRQLVVLDNCEHVIHEAASLCERLIQSNPDIKIVATSREPLRASFERIYRVLLLEVPRQAADHEEVLRCSAVQMFISRARAREPDFLADGESLDLIGVICRRLDGLPLALELAAARVTTLGIGELVTQLDNRFFVLTGGLRTAPARQRSLKATLDWSYQLLCSRERIVLRRISVFHERFRLGEACRIAARDDLTEDDVIEAIAGLASKSLLTVGACGSAMSYALLENVRAYALQMLDEASGSDMTVNRHGPGAGGRSMAGAQTDTTVPDDQQMSLAIPDG